MKRLLESCLVISVISCFLANALYHLEKAGNHPIMVVGNIDQYSQVLPALTFVKKSILAGEFPLWTPYQATGRPFFAHMGWGLLYPINWIILVLDIPRAMLAIQFLNVIVGMVGMVIFLRYLKLEWPGVVLASVLFGYAVFEQTFVRSIGSTYCWLPIIIWMVHQLTDEPSFRTCAGLTVALVVCFFGGFSQYFLYVCMIVFLYLFFMMVFSWPRYYYKEMLFGLSLVGVAFLLTAGLVSVQLLPTLELSLNSVRSLATKLPLGMDPVALKLSPTWFEHFLSRGTSLYYFGSSLLLVPFAFGVRRQRPVVLALTATLAYTILFVISKQVPALAIFGKIPFSDVFRSHQRILPFAHFMGAALVGIGLSSIWERAPFRVWHSQQRKWDWFWVLLTIYTMAVLSFVYSEAVKSVKYSISNLVIFLPFVSLVIAFWFCSYNYSPRMKRLVVGLVSLLAFAVVVYRGSELYPFRYLVIFLPCVFIFFLVLYYASKIPPWAKKLGMWVVMSTILLDVVACRIHIRRTVPATARIEIASRISSDLRIRWIREFAGHSRVLLFHPMSILNPNVGNMFRFFSINSYDSFTLARWRNYVRFVINPEKFDEIFRERLFYGVLNKLSKEFLSQPRMVGLTSFRYYLTPASVETEMRETSREGWKLKYVNGGEEFRFLVFENEFAVPRTYLVNSYVITQNEQESLQAISENISGLLHSVVLEDCKPSFPSATIPESPGKVRINRYGINEVELSVEANEPSLVVLTDSYYPGWNAFVDGIRKPIWRANSLFRAVEVTPGKHTVVFKYRPASLRWGIAVSIVSLLIIAAGLLIRRYRMKL